MRESSAESRFEALRATRTPLVGRDEELAMLQRRWRQAEAGEGCVVLVSGEPGNLLDELQSRSHRAFGVVLVGPRIAEIGEHAVAHVLGDEATVAFDQFGATAVIGADDLPQLLGIEPST